MALMPSDVIVFELKGASLTKKKAHFVFLPLLDLVDIRLLLRPIDFGFVHFTRLLTRFLVRQQLKLGLPDDPARNITNLHNSFKI